MQTLSAAVPGMAPETVKAPESFLKRWGLWVAAAALMVVMMLPPAEGLPVAGQYMLGVLLFAVIVWMTEAVDYAISAVIIAALPFAVMILVYITSPNYIELLWTHPTGRFMMACCAVWMSMGIFVMKKMINFDF